MGNFYDDKDKSVFTRDYYASLAPDLRGRNFRSRDPVKNFWYVIVMGGAFLVLLLLMLYEVTSPPKITASTKNREKITTTVSSPQIVLSDKVKAVNDREAVKASMLDFYDKTGIIPCISILDSILENGKNNYSDDALELYTENTYKLMFKDEEHLLIVLCKNGHSYRCAMYAGESARELLDDEAMQIVKDCFKHYLFEPAGTVHFKNEESYDDEKISDAIDESTKRIMTVTKNYRPYYFAAGMGLVVLLFVLIEIKSKRRRRGKLVIEHEYLPGEYIPQSVLRINDDDNDAYGVRYNYGGERMSVDDIPDSLMHPSWQPTPTMTENARQNAEMPSAEMPSIQPPAEGQMYEDIKVNNAGSTVQYRNNKGEMVYMNGTQKPDESLEKWAAYYNLSGGYSLLNNDDSFKE